MPGWVEFQDYLNMGGAVIVPLILVSVFLWYALTYRVLMVRSSGLSPRELIQQARKGTLQPRRPAEQSAVTAVALMNQAENRAELRSLLHEQLMQVKDQLSRYRVWVHTLVAVAPLLGLLGTVDGMIETFRSLGDMVLFSQSGGIAGGISKALITTQIGLVVSIPGLLLGRIIDRREKKILKDVFQIRDLICINTNATNNSRV